MKNIFEIRLGFWREFAICLGIALAARGSMVFGLNFSSDDYLWLNFYEENGAFSFMASQMRLFAFYLMMLLKYFGAEVPYLGTFWNLIFNSAFVFSGLVAMRIWVPLANSLVMIIGASLFFLFPYHSDCLSYSINSPLWSSMLVVGYISLYFCAQNKRYLILCIIGLTYAVSGQITLVFFFITVLIEAFIWAFKNSNENLWGKPNLIQTAKPWITRLGLLFVSTIIYVSVNKGALFFLDIDTGGRVGILAVNDIFARLVFLIKQTYFFLFISEVSQPGIAKILQFTFYVTILIGCLRYSIKSKSLISFKIAVSFSLVFLLLFSIIFVMSAVAPLKDLHFNQRTLSALGVYWAGIFAISWFVTIAPYRNVVVLIGLVLTASYAFNANRQAVDFARINLRDKFVANRMVERLAQMPDFDKIRTVVLTATTNRFNIEGVSTNTAGFNESALYRDWSSSALLKEVSGMRFQYPLPSDRIIAEKAGLAKKPWPSPESVFIINDIAVIVLPPSLNH